MAVMVMAIAVVPMVVTSTLVAMTTVVTIAVAALHLVAVVTVKYAGAHGVDASAPYIELAGRAVGSTRKGGNGGKQEHQG